LLKSISEILNNYLLWKGEYRHTPKHRWPSHAGLARYKWPISYDSSWRFCQLAVLYCVLGQPTIYQCQISSFALMTIYLNFVIFSYWYRSNIVFLSEFFRQRSTHDSTSDVRRGCEVGLSVFPLGRRDQFIHFRHC